MKWVITSFFFFALFIGILVFVCVREDISLVSNNYYQDELRHQIKMDQQQNMADLKHQPIIKMTDAQIDIFFQSLEKIEKGELRVARPSDERLDQRFELTNQPRQNLKLARWERGLYRVSMQWSMEGKDYYYEKLIVL
ncbi:MAG: FixH family protein [Cyclobacteriaceae bacterium]|nr:FixH family protein [Cyclobacteriaceae bacterium]